MEFRISSSRFTRAEPDSTAPRCSFATTATAPKLQVDPETSTSSIENSTAHPHPAKRYSSSESEEKQQDPAFSHLRLVDLMATGRELELNTMDGIPFETDAFVGRVIFKLRPNDTSSLSTPYKQFFDAYQRKFELQIQGQFKLSSEELRGKTIWLGAELGTQNCKPPACKMQLGFLNRTMCSLVLRAINLMRGPILHYSFGDKTQRPHITMPLYIAADSFIESRGNGQENVKRKQNRESDRKSEHGIPSMGPDMFPTDAESLRARRNAKPKNPYNFHPGVTYSFSLHNGNLDLFNWQAVGIPGIKSIDLTQFWRDMPLRIVAYLNDGSHNDPHSEGQKKYLFCFQLENKNAAGRFRMNNRS